MAGMKALTVYSGEPGTGASWVTWPLSTQTNQNKLNNKFLSINFARQVQFEEYNNFLSLAICFRWQSRKLSEFLQLLHMGC